jgi:site-specific recombinase XerD
VRHHVHLKESRRRVIPISFSDSENTDESFPEHPERGTVIRNQTAAPFIDGQRHDRVPLPPDVGQALADYIRQDRVATTRDLFVSERAPHRPFKGSQILNNTLKEAFRKTGLKPPAPYVGSHVLRHSLATTLLQRGASLEEISDALRDRSWSTTLLYARLDIEGLRSIAQPWPLEGGAK